MTERGWSMLRDRTGSPGTRSSEELVGECRHRHGVWHVQLLRTCTMGEGWFGSIRSYNYIVGEPPYSRKFFAMHNHVHYSLYVQPTDFAFFADSNFSMKTMKIGTLKYFLLYNNYIIIQTMLHCLDSWSHPCILPFDCFFPSQLPPIRWYGHHTDEWLSQVEGENSIIHDIV